MQTIPLIPVLTVMISFASLFYTLTLSRAQKAQRRAESFMSENETLKLKIAELERLLDGSP